jgi:hypothetical protein
MSHGLSNEFHLVDVHPRNSARDVAPCSATVIRPSSLYPPLMQHPQANWISTYQPVKATVIQKKGIRH